MAAFEPATADYTSNLVLRTVLESVPALVYAVDKEGRFLLLNPALERLLGVQPGALLGRTRDEALSQDDALQHRENDQQVLREGVPITVVEHVRSGGQPRAFVTLKVPLRDAGGDILGVVGISTDITDRELMAEQLRDSEAHHRLLFEKNPQPMFVYELATLRFLAVNRAALASWGFGQAEFLNRTIPDLLIPEQVDALRQVVASLRSGQNFSGEWQIRTRSAGLRDVAIHSHSIKWEGKSARFVLCFDITDKKQATDELNRFFTLSQDLLCIVGKDGTIVRLNPQWESTLGYPLAEILARPYTDFIHPDDLPVTSEASATLNDASRLSGFVNRYRCRDGSYRAIEWTAHASEQFIYGVGRDITEKRKGEAHLRDLSRAVEQSPASVIITDVDGCIEYVNPRFTQLTGYTLDEVSGQNPRILQSGLTPREQYAELWQRILSGEVWEGEFQNRKKDGTLYLERVSISPVLDDAGVVRHFVAVKEDITEKRALEQKLLQSQKMEAIGLLTGGIAHDFNNLLTVVNGYAELLESHPDAGPKARACATSIRQAGERAATLTRQLLQFSRRHSGDPTVLDLHQTVAELEHFYRRVLPANIDLVIAPSTNGTLVQADPSQLQQVLMNLVVNARDAMPSGGTLRIDVARVEIAQPAHLELPGPPRTHFIRLSLSDTGEGMTQEVQKHLFEPFFTTKPMGQGTGLGLSTVYGIVRQSNGWIEVRSAPGEGATFHIYLPEAQIAATAEPEPAEAGDIRTGEETILLVEDYAEVRVFTAELLSTLGYEVFQAANGEEALAVAAAHPGEIDLLLTDVMLPGLNGPEIAEKLTAQWPGLPVIFASGYAGELGDGNPALPPNATLIGKPFSTDTLAATIRTVLRRTAASAKILVVDDDPALRELLFGTLTSAGYQVTLASDGADALRHLRSIAPDLILMDLIMPGKEGLETIMEIRRQGVATRIIAMSGAFGGQFLNAARIMGADATLQKPMSRGRLLQKVRETLRKPAEGSADAWFNSGVSL